MRTDLVPGAAHQCWVPSGAWCLVPSRYVWCPLSRGARCQGCIVVTNAWCSVRMPGSHYPLMLCGARCLLVPSGTRWWPLATAQWCLVSSSTCCLMVTSAHFSPLPPGALQCWVPVSAQSPPHSAQQCPEKFLKFYSHNDGFVLLVITKF